MISKIEGAFLLAAMFGGVVGCASHDEEEAEIPIYDQELVVSSTEDNKSNMEVRATGSSSDFNVGDKMHIYATGAANIPHDYMVFNGQYWAFDRTYWWIDGEDTARILAVYPGLEEYTASTIYDADGNLIDVCYQVSDFKSGQILSFNLNHRFSMLIFKCDEGVRNRTDSITLRVQCKVSNVSTTNAEVNVSDEIVECTHNMTEDGCVEFIVPCAEYYTWNETLWYKNGTSESFDDELNNAESNMQYIWGVHSPETKAVSGVQVSPVQVRIWE